MERGGHYNPQVTIRCREVNSNLDYQSWIIYCEGSYLPKNPVLQTISRVRQALKNQRAIFRVKVGELERLLFTRPNCFNDAVKYWFGH